MKINYNDVREESPIFSGIKHGETFLFNGHLFMRLAACYDGTDDNGNQIYYNAVRVDDGILYDFNWDDEVKPVDSEITINRKS